jgi:hypothetical protein
MESPTPESALPEPLPPDSAAPAVTAAAPAVVPYWHTAMLIVVLGVLSVGNARGSHSALVGRSHVRIYLATIAYEWCFTAYVWWGLRRAGLRLGEIIGGRWRRVEDFLLDIAMAVGVWLGTAIVLAVVALSLGMNSASNLDDARKQIGFLVPNNGLEIALWICLSATAGFCEEVLFRGYLQMQFTRLLHNRWAALLLASVLFGLGHGYEGAKRMVLIAVLGFSFGVVSLTRKSLRPAMMAHTLQDTVSGLLLRALR